MIDNLRFNTWCWTETDGRDGRDRADEKQVSVGSRDSSRRDSAAPISSSDWNKEEKKGAEREMGIYLYQSRSSEEPAEPGKKGSSHEKEVVKRWGVSIRGGVPVDMLSVPKLPLRLH